MTATIPLHRARAALSALIARCESEPVTLTRNGVPVAVLVHPSVMTRADGAVLAPSARRTVGLIYCTPWRSWMGRERGAWGHDDPPPSPVPRRVSRAGRGGAHGRPRRGAGRVHQRARPVPRAGQGAADTRWWGGRGVVGRARSGTRYAQVSARIRPGRSSRTSRYA
ncbi:type II toxin-antitoxin system Phd/YefM family antitoxin [Tsukamurella spumae]|uniref:Antitoxin n=1 Tax=Tsukamurella spumae TaxID=44753 RepID=A0A846WYE3_9ACTN|nr:type II toxin-antitoxin system Phd/YefM family antitoxin [Tsukamurella spumae]